MIISVRRREGKKDTWKGNAKVDEVVTQKLVTLDASSCTVRRVAELLKRLLDMEVVLLDSKCYPLRMKVPVVKVFGNLPVHNLQEGGVNTYCC